MDPLDIPLRDIHVPNPVSWWPLAPGWWVLFGVIFVLVTTAVAIVWWRNRHRVRRAAVREFTQIETNFAEHRDTHRLARDLSQLTRRTALAYSPEDGTPALTGSQWVEHLKSLTEAPQDVGAAVETLTRAAYRPDEAFDGDTLLESFRTWFQTLREPRTLGP